MGFSKRNTTLPEYTTPDPMGKTSRVPIKTTGTTGTPALMAM